MFLRLCRLNCFNSGEDGINGSYRVRDTQVFDEIKTTLTWYKSLKVLKPLPDSGVSIHVDHLILQTLSDGR